MITIIAETIRNPRFVSEDGSQINCFVKFSHMKEEHEFTASAYDCEKHGREIWSQCINGDYGEVKAFEPRVIDFNIPDEGYQLNDSEIEFLKYLDLINEENTKKSYRSVAILWGVVLDKILNTLILRSFPDKNPKKFDIGTFDKKIKFSVQYNLITDEQSKRLNCIRHIRNEAAHNWDLTGGNSKLIKNLKFLYELDHSSLFEYIEDAEHLIQMIYSGSAATISIALKNISAGLIEEAN
jgi:hypothetical protein